MSDVARDLGQSAEAVVCKRIIRRYESGGVEVRALDDLTLTVKNGEFLSICGPSGSGKTTLLNIIGGIDRPTSGEVWVGGKRVDGMSKAQLADLRLHKIGFIFQAYNLVPVLSALENVEFVMQLQGVPAAERRERAKSILTEVGLGTMFARRPAQLSGGQQQRVAVARAVVSNPSIVLADEPTANLDSKTAHSLLDLMLKMNQEHGVTFLFSTHDKLVMEHARRIVVLRDGKMESDTTKPDA